MRNREKYPLSRTLVVLLSAGELGTSPVRPEHVAFFVAAEHAVRLRDSRAVYLLPKHDSQIANNASRNKVSRNRGEEPFCSAIDRPAFLVRHFEDVTLVKEHTIKIHIRWKGGATTSLERPVPLSAPELFRTRAEIVGMIRALATEQTNAQIARTLSALASYRQKTSVYASRCPVYPMLLWHSFILRTSSKPRMAHGA
jgi:hypothetical protein